GRAVRRRAVHRPRHQLFLQRQLFRPADAAARGPGGGRQSRPAAAPLCAPSRLARGALVSTLTPAALRLIERALEEDLGRGDVTSCALVDASVRARALLCAKEALTVSGLDVAAAVFLRVDPELEVRARAAAGDEVAAGAQLLTVVGAARSILAAE